jgi:3-oxoacyl-[acyl-carrier-protein] synthase-1
MKKMPVYLNDLGIVCALGHGKTEVAAQLLTGDTSGMIFTDVYSPERMLTLGVVSSTLPLIQAQNPAHHSRNNRLLLCALEEIQPTVDALRERVSSHRIGVVVGTSTSGIAEAEQAIAYRYDRGSMPPGFHYGQQEMGNPAQFLADTLGIQGPVYSVSTACSSGVKALASAARLLRLGVCDVVLAGGADSLCRFTIEGFSALEAVSSERCNPFSANRRGINIGEGAALFIMSREPGEVALLGVGESSDGYHISAPDPSGKGAALAMQTALCQAGIGANDVDYLNLHGTATLQNDAAEAQAVQAVFGSDLPCSSTKPLTGHTLGAAGAIETGLCWLALSVANPQRVLPPHLWDEVPDPTLPPLHLVGTGERAAQLRYIMNSSFAFGGSNAVAVLGRG